MSDPIYRAECAQCSRSLTSSNYDHAERWADAHIDEFSDHVVVINQLEGE